MHTTAAVHDSRTHAISETRGRVLEAAWLAAPERCVHMATCRAPQLHLYVQPPYDATQWVTMPDVKALRVLPGVYGVDRRGRPGDRTDWRAGSAGRILDVWVKAASLDELLSRVDAIDSAVATTTEWNRS